MTGSLDLAALAERARSLTDGHRRAVLGITGPPGAGKTTLVERLMVALRSPAGPWAGAGLVAHVPMDGFHLADVQLDRLGLRDRKGAPESFDVRGYAAALERIVAEAGHATVYVPGFERVLEQPVAAAIDVPADARLIVTEGNYLLLDGPDWRRARSCLTEVWYVDVPGDLCRERLVRRHVEFGKTHDQAVAWVSRSDEANATLVRLTRDKADLVLVP